MKTCTVSFTVITIVPIAVTLIGLYMAYFVETFTDCGHKGQK